MQNKNYEHKCHLIWLLRCTQQNQCNKLHKGEVILEDNKELVLHWFVTRGANFWLQVRLRGATCNSFYFRLAIARILKKYPTVLRSTEK
jgi:hypothetical protein